MNPNTIQHNTLTASSDRIQQAILQQVQAVDEDSRAGLSRSRRRQVLIEKKDLAASEQGENDTTPPSYGEVYGEVSGERNGLATAANVTNDGRVNIRVNQLNRRLSQVFIPAPREQTEDAQDDLLPPPYIPSSLGGSDTPPPSLNIVIQVVGSRGDVQPFVALGKVLKQSYGHRIRLATHPTFKGFVEENGLEFFSIGGDPSRLMAFMVKNPSLMPSARSVLSGDISQRRKDVSEYIQGCWRSCYETGNGLHHEDSRKDTDDAAPFVADCIIANPPSFAHVHCAERLGIPLHVMFTMPYSPTQAFPHPLANIQSSSNADPQLTNYISYAMIEVLSWQGLGEIINRFRTKCLGLDPISLIWAPGMLERLRVPHTYFWSPALIPKPKDWKSHISISGFSLLDLATSYTPTPELQAFLNAGPPPIYIGFGSIVLEDPSSMTELIFSAVAKTGQRCLLSQGWGGIGADTDIPKNVFILGNVPHDWLFKHVSCVVHHGGAGTTAAGISAGRPTLIVPFFGDQPFWGAMVALSGAGPTPIPHKQLTSENLADAIEFGLKADTLASAEKLANQIASENGSQTAAQCFHQFLNVDRLRCTLIPSRTAVWRIRKTKVRLSAYAACTLANAKLLDFKDLKPFRAQEYETDEGPWDPVSGFAAGLFGAVSSMALGVVDMPSETWRAMQMPFESKQKGSEKAMSQSRRSSHVSNGVSRPQKPLLHGTSRTRSSTEQASDGTTSRSETNAKLLATPDLIRQRNVHTSRGLGRIVKTALQSPIDLSMGITKGFHNMPRMWGDETVRPQEKVSDLKTGFTAVGREFGFGFYDGVTGLVTQPYRGLQKEGPTGFFKGLGKGLGGFVAKPGAALFGIPSHFMKGVHKELRKLYSGNVQSYIVATRTAQGYEEWLQSNDTERQDVVDQWHLIQRYLKGKHKPEDMMADMLIRHRSEHSSQRDGDDTLLRSSTSSIFIDTTRDDSSSEHPTSYAELADGSTQPVISSRSSTQGVTDDERNKDKRLDRISLSAGQISAEDINELHEATTASLDEAQQHAKYEQQFEMQLRQVMAQSLMQEEEQGNDIPQATQSTPQMVAHNVVDGPSNISSGYVFNPQHLDGVTRSQFEARQGGGQGKTAQERMEEDIVLEYIKKQSLLDMQHRKKAADSMSDR